MSRSPEEIAIVVEERLRAAFEADPSRRGVNIARLAAELSVGSVALIRAFKRTFAVPPYQYFLRLRLGLALRLVGEGPSPRCANLAAVARRCGYVDVSHMRQAFRRGLGMTATDYQRAVGNRALWTRGLARGEAEVSGGPVDRPRPRLQRK